MYREAYGIPQIPALKPQGFRTDTGHRILGEHHFYLVSSFKFQVSSFKFQVSSFKFQVSSYQYFPYISLLQEILVFGVETPPTSHSWFTLLFPLANSLTYFYLTSDD